MRWNNRLPLLVMTCIATFTAVPGALTQTAAETPGGGSEPKMKGSQAVILHAKVIELHVSKMRSLGLDFQTIDGDSIEQFCAGTPVKLTTVRGLISALRKQGLVKVLAEATLVTTSGRPASFHCGGEFPIIVPQDRNTVAIEYREFGTHLDCVANVSDRGRIAVELRVTVSEIDISRSVEIQNTSVPGLRTRAVDTVAQIEAGQTLVLSGATKQQSANVDGSTKDEETALLVTLTVELGEPSDHGT